MKKRLWLYPSGSLASPIGILMKQLEELRDELITDFSMAKAADEAGRL